MNSLSFEKLSPYLSDPLVLIGFFLLLFFGLARALIKSKLLTPVSGIKSYRLLQTLFAYGFALGVLVIALGFGLKYRDLSQAEQRNAIELLKGEFNANASAVEAMRLNTVTLLTVLQKTAQSVRQPGITTLETLFPTQNVQGGSPPPPSKLAAAALNALHAKGIDRNARAMAQGDQAARAIVGVIERTRPTIVSLADAKHERYVIRDTIWEANAPILRKVNLDGVSALQDTYTQLRDVRSDYDVVCASVLAYLDSLLALFDPKIGVNPNTLAAALAQERQSVTLVTAYGATLTDAIANVQRLQTKLAGVGRPVAR